MKAQPVIVEKIFNKPIEKIWESITKPESMRQWFFDNIPDFKPDKGFSTHFDVNANGKIYPHLWKVLEVEKMKRIVIEWRYGGYTGDSTATFELIPGNNHILFRVICEGIETFPQDNPDFSRESCTAGWNYIIGTRLKEFLEKSNVK